MSEKEVGKDAGKEEGEGDKDEALEGVLKGDEGLGLGMCVHDD